MKYSDEIYELIKEIEKLKDNIEFIKYNKEDGPKFDSIQEMKDLKRKFEIGEFDCLFNKNESNIRFIDKEQIIKNGNMFLVYLYKKDNNYITSLALKMYNSNDIIYDLYANKNENYDITNESFNKLKEYIKLSDTDIIINELYNNLIDIKNKLKSELEELTGNSWFFFIGGDIIEIKNKLIEIIEYTSKKNFKKAKELKQSLEKEILSSYKNNNDFKRLFDTIMIYGNFSFFNSLLIDYQCPNFFELSTQKDYSNKGINISKNAKEINILVPTNKNLDLVTLFDCKDTDIKPENFKTYDLPALFYSNYPCFLIYNKFIIIFT